MKLLVFADPFPGLIDFFYGLSDKDSGQPAFYRVIKELDKQDHEVLVIVPTFYPSKWSHQWKNTQIFAYHSPLSKKIWKKIVDRIHFGSLYFSQIILGIMSFYYGMKFSKTEKYDLVIGHWEFAILSAYFVGKLRGIPNVSRLYGSNLYGRTNGDFRWRKLIYNLNRILPFIVPSSLYICTQDGTRAEEGAKYFGIPSWKFIHVFNGVDRPDKSAATKADDNVHVTFIGHLQGWKNPMRLMELVPMVVSRNKNVKIHFVGDGAEENKLREYIKKNELEDFVFIHGRLPQQKKNLVLANTDIYISFYSFSNMSNTMLESMVNGKAILTLDEGIISRFLINGETAIIIDNWDKNHAFENLLWLINNPKEVQRLGKSAQRWATENIPTWDERAKFEIDLYERIVRKNS